MAPKSAQKRHTSAPGAGPSTKKARFAEETLGPGVDDATFAQHVEEELEPAGASRRGGIKTEGYDSDSSDDGEGVVESRKRGRKNKRDADDDVDDMFGGDDQIESDDDGTTKKKKEVKFMSLGDIDGQEFGRAGSSGPEEEDEPEDEDEAERRRKRGMGFEMSGFNMRSEMEEGKFAEDGTFVRSFDPHQVHDKWMDGVSEDIIKKAKRSKKKMEAIERERERKEEEENLAGKRKEELQMELLEHVKPGESVLQTLARLGAEKKNGDKAKPRTKSRSAKSVLDPPIMDVEPSEKAPASSETSAIDRVTSLASMLMSMGDLNVYDETHRTLLFAVRESGLVPQDWVPPSATPPSHPPQSLVKYQYRWSPSYLATASGGAKEGDIFGPYGKDELLAWKSASYFGPSGERVELRRVGEDSWGGWGLVV